MGQMYFVRHGETIWNVQNKICGATDIALTERGHSQAIELGKRLAQEMAEGNITIDEILYSPLIRAADTAHHISVITGVPEREELRLKEQNFGCYESTPRDGEEFALAKMNFLNHFGNGETMMHLCQRIYNLLDEITAQEEKTYLLVAHNGIARAVHSYFYDMENEEFARFGIKNCELCKYKF